jgi:L-threonylcarbamoyladenylate synthase
MFLLRDDIGEISSIILKGGIICYPTDTVWAIGCDAANSAALDRISTLKGKNTPGYIALVDSIAMLRQWVPMLEPRLETLLGHHMRPLTMIYPQHVGVPEHILAQDGSVAIRVVHDEFCQALIREVGRPIISTSACKDAQTPPATFGGISSDILGAMDYVVKYRQDDKTPHEPSPIARLDSYHELEFIRE